jgi:ketosteroid isomerase-like protein
VRPGWYHLGMADSASAVFRRFHEAWTDGDLPAVLAVVDPEIVVHPLHGVMFSRMEFRGHDGILDWYREMTEPWDRFEALVDRVVDTPGGATGVITVVGYRGDEGFHARIGVDTEMRDGRILTLTARDADDLEQQLDGGDGATG